KTSSTLADLLSLDSPSHAAVILPEDGAITMRRGLAEQVEALAARLRQTGLQPGQPVAIVLPNGLEYLVAFLAVARARLVAAPLNPAYKADEFRFYLEDIGARAIIAPPGGHPVRDVARDLGLVVWDARLDGQGRATLEGEKAHGSQPVGLPEAPRPEDVALFLHTSGTTSRPKGVPLTHGNLMTSIRNIANHYRLTPEDVGLVVMPLFHVHGLIGATLAPLFAGGTVVVPPRFSAGAFWPAARAHRVTWYSAAPTIHQILLTRADADGAPAHPGFRFIRSCSAALAGVTLAGLESRFDAPVLEAYAMTEAAHQMTSNPLPPGTRKPGTVGRGTNVDVAIMDEAGNLLPGGAQGEVVVRGPNVTPGYHNNPTANAASFTNGWFRTGDRGVLDGDGYLTLIGRIKELINRGGEKISPLEVDAVLLAHPAVAEAATFGAPDAKYGEEVHAAVVLKGEATVEQLQAHCQDRLASFKVPKVIYLAKEMPRTATGKIQRRHVAAAFLQSATRRA
ncbi:MAG TPA: acyl--CoA ligase, partial [Gemmataceae bacterium]|nr:acyl--CoA ligase [Gemmataceae bacterium]